MQYGQKDKNCRNLKSYINKNFSNRPVLTQTLSLYDVSNTKLLVANQEREITKVLCNVYQNVERELIKIPENKFFFFFKVLILRNVGPEGKDPLT